MNQAAHQALTAMWNSFALTGQDYRLLAATYDTDLANQTNEAIIEAAHRFRNGKVPGQSDKFAPSQPEFATEVERQEQFIALRQRPRLPEPRGFVPAQEIPGSHERMRLKMPLYSYAQRNGLMADLDRANREGFGAMVTFATKWGTAIPQELLERPDAEDEWRRAHNRIWAELERNPPPFMRTKRWQSHIGKSA